MIVNIKVVFTKLDYPKKLNNQHLKKRKRYCFFDSHICIPLLCRNNDPWVTIFVNKVFAIRNIIGWRKKFSTNFITVTTRNINFWDIYRNNSRIQIYFDTFKIILRLIYQFLLYLYCDSNLVIDKTLVFYFYIQYPSICISYWWS